MGRSIRQDVARITADGHAVLRGTRTMRDELRSQIAQITEYRYLRILYLLLDHAVQIMFFLSCR